MPRKSEPNDRPNPARLRLMAEIKKLREELGKTQRDVAAIMGIDPSTVSDIENIEKPIYTFPIENLVGIAKALGVSPHKLLAIYTGEEPEKYTQKDKELLTKIIGLIDDYRNPGNPPNVPQSSRPTPTHLSQIGPEAEEVMDRIDAEREELKRGKTINKPIENKDF